MNRRTLAGVAISGVYASSVLAYAIWGGHDKGLFKLELNNFGDFLAGLAAPLAFLWLVIGYLQQGEELRLQRQQLELQRKELALQREETRRLADEAKRQASAIEANELHARRDTFFRQADFTMNELNSLAFTLLIALNRPPFAFDIRAISEERARGNDHKYFELLLLVCRSDKGSVQSILAPRAADDIDRYVNLCGELIRSADRADPERTLRRLYRGTKALQLYEQLCLLFGRASIFEVD